MYGSGRPFRPRAGPPHFFPQNPNPNIYPFSQNLNHPNPNLNPLAQNHNPYLQNPNFSSSSSYNPYLQNPPRFVPPPLSGRPSFQPSPKPEETLEKIERAVGKAHRDLLATGEGVSAWKVSQSALLSLQVDSLSSLGFQLQDIPSLYRLIVTEGKVNAFIHCFVGARRITSLYDLNIAICKNEGVDRFEELGMGPLLRNPLVEHYFLVPSDVTEIFKITSDEIITYLIDYMDTCGDKDIRAEDLLKFLAEKRSVAAKERIGIRIQSLGMHITSIRKAREAEKTTLQRHLQAVKHASGSIVSEKQVLDRRFNAISERLKSFSSVYEGKHIRFVLSSSDDDNDDDDEEDNSSDNDSNGWCQDSSQNRKNNDQCVSSCPYPSASEEMLRLGLKVEVDDHASPASVSLKGNESKETSGKKRKFENQDSNPTSFSKLPKIDKAELYQRQAKDILSESIKSNKRKKNRKGKESVQSLQISARKLDDYGKPRNKLHGLSTGVPKDKSQSGDTENHDEENLTLTSDDMEKFITTWKDTCREHSVVEVFDKMLNFYKKDRRRRKLKLFFSSYPLIGLLNIAVTSIKRGMWDSIYDTFQAIGENGFVNPSSTSYTDMMDIGPSSKSVPVSNNNEHLPTIGYSITVDDIIKKIATYFEFDCVMPRGGKLHLKDQTISFRKFVDCEEWLKKQFSIKKFSSLGHGDFLEFLEKHVSLSCYGLHKALTGEIEVSMLQRQLLVILCQAVSALGGNVVITKQQISSVIRKQFPLISFQLRGTDPDEDFLDLINRQKNSDVSRCVLFSVTLLGTGYIENSLVQNTDHSSEVTEMNAVSSQKTGYLGSISGKDAIECLLKTPMLSDLRSWSHWDLIFAPSLGPLLEWLLNGVNTKELSCIVTSDGKLIRIEPSATVDEFLEAALQGSSFQTAVKLLSLLSLYGGMCNVPLSLLKCYAHRAFEVIIKNSLTSGVKNNGDPFMHGKASSVQIVHAIDSDSNPCSFGTLDVIAIADDTENNELRETPYITNKGIGVASKFVLDCVAYLPSEFRSFAADVLLSGLRSFIKDAPAAILLECNQTEHRIMLHNIGFTLGILEWINDYHAFTSVEATSLFVSSGTLSMTSETLDPAFSRALKHTVTSDNLLATDGKMVSLEARPNLRDAHREAFTGVHTGKVLNEVSAEMPVDGCTPLLCQDNQAQDASLIIESIRREEFGLDPNLEFSESRLLKKQHARLGRALHCLSHELYSQDSHFVLELVQNADDNIYPENVEPTLVLILQSTGIVVLNNEQGFSAQNIKALCDVGNSTKKGSSTGYIGQKGIGFKSVFRVTDAPEIHSNGFHVKFDASEGQIGFVLPTVVSPCDINLFMRQLSGEVDQTDSKCWNTCVVLPFRSNLKEGTEMSSILSMFSDFHPSLLLFLHRLQCIKFRNMLNDTLIIMRKEILGDGIVKVSHGKDKMIWLVVSQSLQACTIRPDVQTTEIAIAFTLQESSKGEYKPHLEQQPVFAFLPLRTYGLKFILQGDFILPSSREEVDEDSAWNQWLLSEFPALFVSAERSFCSLPCFRENPGKAVTVYMSFVPLAGEVHGFFSHLPHMIISKLRMSNCLLLEGQNMPWVPPCRVLRGWNEQARTLLPEDLLHQHLGLGYMNKDINLADPLAKALGIQDYGPGVLVEVISSICHINNGINSMGLDWLSSWLDVLYTTLSVCSSVHQTSVNSGIESDVVNSLRKIPFIPLSDGSYGSLAEGPIWLPCDAFNSEAEHRPKDFPNLYAKLRTVNPVILSALPVDTYSMEDNRVDNLQRMLLRIGAQRLSPHEVIKTHIFPAMPSSIVTFNDRDLMTEYLCFVMYHLHTTCPGCFIERDEIISELRKKAFVLTNHGYKRPSEVSIHFSKEFGNTVDISKLIDDKDAEWYEVDAIYLKHPSTQSLSSGLMKWREFFQGLGVTDFLRMVHIEKKVADVSHTIFQNMSDEIHSSAELIIEDWESPELISLLSTLSSKKYQDKCKYLLEVLDKMWDDCFSAKVTGSCAFNSTENRKPFDSSFIKSIHEYRWIASSIGDELHYPKDLFYDCEAVRFILGASAPYAVPQVKNKSFLNNIRFKTQVTLDDALTILQYWKTCETPFRASIAQMSKFYSFIWDGIITKGNVVLEFRSGATIFVPLANKSRHEDVVSGLFLHPAEVYWDDPTGCVDRIRELVLRSSSMDKVNCSFTKTLVHIYPSLREFFVNECGVQKIPPFHSYVQILQHLSIIALPSEAADPVFRVLLKWADDLKSGVMESEEILYLKESLLKSENAVLPTVLDKWVSLHPSFGVVCWCDDEELRKQFKHCNNIDFLYFGEHNEKEIIPAKVSMLLQTIGVPALSEVVSREAVFYGMEDCMEKASLVDWVLPYAQRYLSKVHPDTYFHLKQFGYENLNQLQVVVVENLFYKHTIKGCDNTSKKRYECSCLLQGNTLYVTRASDYHSIFFELSRFFFKGSAELHLANFLHMIMTMAESGSTEEQTEFFIVNNQKVPKLPDEEPVWALSHLSRVHEEEIETSQPIDSSLPTEQKPLKPKRKPGISSNWPPTDWKSAPGFHFARLNHFRRKERGTPSGSAWKESNNSIGSSTHTEEWPVPTEIDGNWIVPDDSLTPMESVFQDSVTAKHEPLVADSLGSVDKQLTSTLQLLNGPPDSGAVPHPGTCSSTFTTRDQICLSMPSQNQAFITGRLGELVAYKYFVEKYGPEAVRWVNEETETGLPYDLVIRVKDENKEYVEVKATKSIKKDWFTISTREWQFASERGNSFSIAHVLLADPKNAKITVFKDPLRLCQKNLLNLVILMSGKQKESAVVT